MILMFGSHNRLHRLSNPQVRKERKYILLLPPSPNPPHFFSFFSFFLAEERTIISYCLLSPWLYNIMFYFFATRHIAHLPRAYYITFFFLFILTSVNWGHENKNRKTHQQSQTPLPSSPLDHALWSQVELIQLLALPSCRSFGKSLNLSVYSTLKL